MFNNLRGTCKIQGTHTHHEVFVPKLPITKGDAPVPAAYPDKDALDEFTKVITPDWLFKQFAVSQVLKLPLPGKARS
jgi:hypothetical protein